MLNGLWRRHPRYAGCCGHWLFSHAGGDVVPDVSGWGYHGTVNGTILWEIDFEEGGLAGDFPGTCGYNIELDGSTTYVSTDNVILETAEAFALVATAKVDAITGGTRNILAWQGDSAGNGGGAEHEFDCGFGTVTWTSIDRVIWFFWEGGSNTNDIRLNTPELSIGTNNFHHIVATGYNLGGTATVSLYVDGELIGTDTGTPLRSNFNTAFQIGKPGVNDPWSEETSIHPEDRTPSALLLKR